ncbi:MAG: signal peptidase I [Thermodesulfovibrionales bacterium]
MSEQVLASKAEQSDFFADLLNRGLSLRVRVTGRSMQPFLRGGEIVTIKKVPCAELRIGDLIFFESSHGVLVLHRIVRKKLSDSGSHIFQTRGDGLMSFDEEIHEGSVLGKVLLIEKPSQSGKTTHINMNSLFYRCMNFSIAVAGFFKTQTWFFLSAALAKKT